MTGYRLGSAAAALIGVAGAVSALTVPRRTSRAEHNIKAHASRPGSDAQQSS
jgi:hypothetical protein